MSNLISDIDLQDNFPAIKLYHLFQTSSKEKNNEISKILEKYPNSQNFFNHYTQTNISNILNTLNNLQNNLTDILSFPENYNSLSDIEQYISNTSKIILLFNLISQNEKIINNLLISTKKFALEANINEKSILKKYINLLKKFQIAKTVTIKNNKFQKSKRDFSRKSTKENTCNNTQNLYNNNTSRFQLKEIKRIKNNSTDGRKHNVRKDSILSFANMVFINEPELNNITNVKRNKTNLNIRKKYKQKINIKEDRSYLSYREVKINDKTKMCSDLLEVVNQLYKNCKLNSEEKVRIKQLILSKNKKIEEIYFNIYSGNSINEESIDKFFIEFKKIL